MLIHCFSCGAKSHCQNSSWVSKIHPKSVPSADFRGLVLSLNLIFSRQTSCDPAPWLGAAWDIPGDVCQQSPQWAGHFGRPPAAEPMVDTHWMCGNSCLNFNSTYSGSGQVSPSFSPSGGHFCADLCVRCLMWMRSLNLVGSVPAYVIGLEPGGLHGSFQPKPSMIVWSSLDWECIWSGRTRQILPAAPPGAEGHWTNLQKGYVLTQVCKIKCRWMSSSRSSPNRATTGWGGWVDVSKASSGEKTSRQLFPPHRSAIAAGLYGYNGVLVGLLMAVFSVDGDYNWWLLLPVALVSMTW